MKYPLFLCDFDGTLVRSDGTVSDNNRTAIQAYRAAGGIFVVCTGRMLVSIRARLSELGISEGLVVAYQGAQIADVATGKLLKDGVYAREDILEILSFMEARGWVCQVYIGNDVIAKERTPYLDAYERICRVEAKIAGEPLSAFVAREDPPVVKVLAFADPKEQRKVYEELEARFGEKYFVACSADSLVEVMPREHSKGAAVSFLSEYYGIAPERMAAIGDQGNDVPMVAAVGGRFAVANAVEELRKISRVVASYEEDGVAQALKIAMGEEE